MQALFSGRGVISAFEMTGSVLIAGELGAEIDSRSAALSVIGAYCEIVGAVEDLRADGKVPASADAGYIEIELAGFVQIGKIQGAHVFSRIGIEDGRLDVAVEGDRSILRATHKEGFGRLHDESNFGSVRQIANLIDFDCCDGRGFARWDACYAD